MVDALADTIDGELGIKRIKPTPNFLGEVVVEELLSDLELLDDPLVLVIDDLHELQAAEALTWLELFLARMPPKLRLVLGTRQEPELGLHRLRLDDRLVEVRASDLCFSQDETRALLEASDIATLGRGGSPASGAHRRVGRRPPARRDLAGRAPRPRAIREGVLRQRAHGGRLSARGGAGAPAGRGPRPAATHLDPRPGERTAGRLPHGVIRVRAGSASPRGRQCLRHLARRGAIVVPLSPPVCRLTSPRAPPDRSHQHWGASPEGGQLARGAWISDGGDQARPAGRGLAACRAPARRQLPHSARRWPHTRRPRATGRLSARGFGGGRGAGTRLCRHAHHRGRP